MFDRVVEFDERVTIFCFEAGKSTAPNFEIASRAVPSVDFGHPYHRVWPDTFDFKAAVFDVKLAEYHRGACVGREIFRVSRDGRHRSNAQSNDAADHDHFLDRCCAGLIVLECDDTVFHVDVLLMMFLTVGATCTIRQK